LALQLKQQSEQQKAALDSQAQQQATRTARAFRQQKMMQPNNSISLICTRRPNRLIWKRRVKMQMENVKIAAAQASAHQQIQSGQQQLAHTEQVHQVKLQHAKEISKSQPRRSKGLETTILLPKRSIPFSLIGTMQ
jgi:hypothetical protein